MFLIICRLNKCPRFWVTQFVLVSEIVCVSFILCKVFLWGSWTINVKKSDKLRITCGLRVQGVGESWEGGEGGEGGGLFIIIDLKTEGMQASLSCKRIFEHLEIKANANNSTAKVIVKYMLGWWY